MPLGLGSPAPKSGGISGKLGFHVPFSCPSVGPCGQHGAAFALGAADAPDPTPPLHTQPLSC